MGQADDKPEPIGILGFIGGQGHIWFVTNLAKRDLADIRRVTEAQKFGLKAAKPELPFHRAQNKKGPARGQPFPMSQRISA